MRTNPMTNRWTRDAKRLLSVGALSMTALLASGCAGRTARFTPAEAAGEKNAPGAAYYEIVAQERNWGDVKVWSEGAAVREVEDGDDLELIHAALRVRNDSDAEIELVRDRTYLEVTTEEGKLRVVRQIADAPQVTTIAPAATERLELLFELPADIEANDLNGFELNWTLRAGPDAVYTQSTPFERLRRRSGDKAGYGFYPRFGLGFGYGRPWYGHYGW